MAQAGHVVQARAETDGRARELALTAKGARVAREVESASRTRFERVLAAVPRAERTRVLDALGVLNAAVEAFQSEESSQ
jgi:DNA-binding MarR family transcriptional regulator